MCAEHANVLRSRSEVERINRALHEIRKTCDYKHISFTPSTHERKYLNLIFSSTTRFAISVDIILSGGRKLHLLSQLCYHCATQALKY